MDTLLSHEATAEELHMAYGIPVKRHMADTAMSEFHSYPVSFGHKVIIKLYLLDSMQFQSQL